MNEALQNSLASIINTAVSGVEAGVQFLSDQLPDVVQQLVLYTAAINGVWLVLAILIPVLSYLFYSRHNFWNKEEAKWNLAWRQTCDRTQESQYKLSEEEAERKAFLFFALTLVGGIGSVVAIILGLIAIATLVKLWLAPKVWLIQYAADLAK